MPLAIEEAYDIDKTIIIGTVGSMWDNLYEKYWDKIHSNKKQGKDEKYKESLLAAEINSNSETPINRINIRKFNSWRFFKNATNVFLCQF